MEKRESEILDRLSILRKQLRSVYRYPSANDMEVADEVESEYKALENELFEIRRANMPKKIVDQIKKDIRDSGLNFIEKDYYVRMYNVDERVPRQAISELSKEGIIYLPTGTKGVYKRYLESDYKEAERIARRIQKSLRTIYFNRLVPLMPLIKDKKLREELGQMQLVLQESEKGK
jgi:ribosomal protein S25